MADQITGTSGLLRLDVSESDLNPITNSSTISWALYFIERSASNTTFANGVSASVELLGSGTLWSGSFDFDWRAGGLQTKLIASGSYFAGRNPDGTGSIVIRGSMGSTGTSAGGGPATVDQPFTLARLSRVPGTPTGLFATRIDDGRADLVWAQSSPSNGQPTTNDIRSRVNDGAFGAPISISPATAATLGTQGNQKIEYQVRAWNQYAGFSDWSNISTPIYTTPGAPSNVQAVKASNSNITVTFTENVGYAEHEHEVWHGVVSGGVTTWDGAPLATLPSGTTSYVHVSPNAAQVHIYRVRAKAGALLSGYAVSNAVQLLAAPAKPTVPTPPARADKAAAFRFAWVHNPVDSTAQTKRQVRYSLNGGSTWTTGAKTTSTDQFIDYAANMWTANQAVTFQVRTKGLLDTGSDGDASYSPWSDSVTVTFKTKPVVTITSPANGSTQDQATLSVALGFSQAEAAAFVSATIGLFQGATLLEQKVSNTLAGTAFDTRLADGVSYSVKATVLDANGLTSAQVTSTFSVDYTEPVAAGVEVIYLADSGIAQLQLTIPAPGVGQAAATTVSIERVIDGRAEAVLALYPASPAFTVLDTTPTIRGTNLYRITTSSADGAATVVEESLVTAEGAWAYLSTGPAFDRIIRFSRRLITASAPRRERELVAMSNREFPVALFGPGASFAVSGSATVLSNRMRDAAGDRGSSAEEVEDFLLSADLVCYRDPDHRIIGTVEGSIVNRNGVSADFQYTVERSS